jgi:hypothetical protein
MSKLGNVRRQLTLFAPGEAAASIELVREKADPVQFALIAAHVTLCREDEFAELELSLLRERLARAAPLTLTFGPARRFGGHGILLPCIEGAADFQKLRVQALGATDVRDHEAHLTIAHPRNPRAPANQDALLSVLPAPLTLVFREVALIEQSDALPWVVLETLRLAPPASSVSPRF